MGPGIGTSQRKGFSPITARKLSKQPRSYMLTLLLEERSSQNSIVVMFRAVRYKWNKKNGTIMHEIAALIVPPWDIKKVDPSDALCSNTYGIIDEAIVTIPTLE